jgi:predicted DNA-binding transcriptional regulator YafY
VDRTERFYRIQQLLRARRAVPLEDFLATLEVSRATFKRDVEYLRSRLSVPIVWDRDAGGYRLDTSATGQELPGLWFSAGEAHALLTMHHLLENLEPGLLESHLAPLIGRLEKLLGSRGHATAEVRRRIRIVHAARRRMPVNFFETIAQGLLERRRLRIRHYHRAADVRSERSVSPQRLVHYRENWYLDAWCHLREDLRSFAVDAIETAQLEEAPALSVPDAELDARLASGYGIFSGERVEWATLRFSAQRARWVSAEQWHPQQRSHVEPDGSYVLEFPYSDSRELLMDILKHGPEVEVVGPPALRDAVCRQLERSLARYRSD